MSDFNVKFNFILFLNMSEQSDSICPICTHEFSTPEKVPKLLPCYHTFCSPCLDNMIASTPLNSDSTFRCPICRQGASIPKNGVQGFFDNYFRCAPQKEKTCDICGAGDNYQLDYCKECNSLLCDSCHKKYHPKKTKDDKSDEDDDEIDDKSPSDSSFSKDNSVKTAKLGNHGNQMTFKWNNLESIRKIIPDDKNECWALTNQPYVTRFSRSGKETSRKCIDNIDNVLQDIARMSDGTLVLAFSNGEILLYNGQALRYVTNTGNVPTALYAFQDGRLLIATRPHSGSTRLNNSELLITDQTMKKIQPLDVNVDLQEVSSITVNEKNGQIALCEPSKKVVLILDTVSCKKLKFPSVKKYRGISNLLKEKEKFLNTLLSILYSLQYPLFQPRSVESDQNNGFCVLDGNNSIHGVDEEANLRFIVPIRTDENISCFHVDSNENNIWFGSESGQIFRTVFRTNRQTFVNEIQHYSDFENPDDSDDSETQESVSVPGGSGLQRVRSSDSAELSENDDPIGFPSYYLLLDDSSQIQSRNDTADQDSIFH